MGKSQSKQLDVTDTGVVNNNFKVEEESVSVPSDIRVVLYVIAVALVILVGIKIQKAYRRGLKKNFSRSMVIRSQAGEV